MEPIREIRTMDVLDDLRIVRGFAAATAIGAMFWLAALIIALR